MDFNGLNRFDLNTLVALKALLDERHVTRASNTLSLTQSALSRTLARLRQYFDDPLLVKSGKHLSLTPKAVRLYEPLTLVLEQVSALLKPEYFEPESAKDSISIATNDYGSHTLLPKLVPLLNEVAPGIQINTLEWRSSLMNELEENKVDLIIAGTTSPPQNIYQKIIANDDIKGLVRKGHPNEKSLSLAQYLTLNHIMISPNGSGPSEVDEILSIKGLERKVALRIPHFFAALEIIAKTDHLVLLPEHFIRRYADSSKFSTVAMPFDFT